MIRFDFIVTDEEADTIFDCIQSEIGNVLNLKWDTDPSNAVTKWYDSRIEYLKKLKKKMSHETYP
jgi:hypothetical protein